MESSKPKSSKLRRQPSIFTKDFDKRVWLFIAVVATCVVVGNGWLIHAGWQTRIRVGYQPDQPIQFSHPLHAGTLGIDCRYCHSNVDLGPHATVPPLSTCMNCHAQFDPAEELKPVAEEHKKTRKLRDILTERFDEIEASTDEHGNKKTIPFPDRKQMEKYNADIANLAAEVLRIEQKRDRIKELTDRWDNKEPVVWNKVYDLADFAYFPHNRHTAAGIDCKTCHGDVMTQEKIKQVAPLTMGWCLQCHKGNNTSIVPDQDSPFAQLTGEDITGHKIDGKELTESMKKDVPVYGELLAPINCSTCHR